MAAIRRQAGELADQLDRSQHDHKKAHELMIALDDLHRENRALVVALFTDKALLQGHEHYHHTWKSPGKALVERLNAIAGLALGKPKPRAFDPFAAPFYTSMREALRLD